MNPNEAWIGKVLFVGAVALVLWGITALFQAKGESARRARLVIGGAVGLIVAWAWFMMVGPFGFTGTLVVLGAGYWVFSGSKK